MTAKSIKVEYSNNLYHDLNLFNYIYAYKLKANKKIYTTKK